MDLFKESEHPLNVNETISGEGYTLILKDNHRISLKAEELKNILKLGLKMSGVLIEEEIDSIVVV